MENYQNPYVDPYPGLTQSGIDARRRFALGVMQQATDSSPTKANAIGAIARALQGAMGGYFAGQADQSDAADKAKTQGLVQQLIGGGSSTGAINPQATASPTMPSSPGAPSPQITSNAGPVPDQSGAISFDPNDRRIPASIRTNNPGAQWMGPVAKQFGATSAVGLSGGNNAAVFSNPIDGAAAQFALWGKRYTGLPLSSAISKWSGGNSSPAYTNFIYQHTGLTPNTVLTPDIMNGPQGLALVKAQAQWEAGRPYPMSDDQWSQAQRRAFGGNTQVASNDPNFVPQQSQQPDVTNSPGLPAQSPVGNQPPQQVAQNSAPTSAVGDQSRASAIAQLLSTRSGSALGGQLAGTLIGQNIAPPEFKTLKNIMGEDIPYVYNKNTQQLTPLAGGNPGGIAGAVQAAGSDDLMKSAEAKYPGVTNRVEQLYRGEGGVPNKRQNPLDGPAMQLIEQVHPDWNMATWTAKNKMQQQLSSSSSQSLGGRLGALRNAFDHLANTSDVAINKGNYDFGLGPLSTVVNEVKSLTTDQRDLSSKLEREAVTYGGERTKFLTGSEGSEAERKAFLNSLGPDSAAPPQMAGTIEGEYTQLKSALINQEQQVREQLGDEYLTKKPIITKEVKDSMDRIEKNIQKLRGNGSSANKSTEQSAGISVPPQAAAALRSNPALADQFDEKYGQGSSAKIIGGK